MFTNALRMYEQELGAGLRSRGWWKVRPNPLAQCCSKDLSEMIEMF